MMRACLAGASSEGIIGRFLVFGHQQIWRGANENRRPSGRLHHTQAL